jgi:hypothetical protein
MVQLSDSTSLGAKRFHLAALCYLCMKYFNGSLSIQVDMLTQVDFSEATLSDHSDEFIVTELLSSAVPHGHNSVLNGGVLR